MAGGRNNRVPIVATAIGRRPDSGVLPGKTSAAAD